MKGILVIRKMKEATPLSGYLCRMYASGNIIHDRKEAELYISKIPSDDKWKQVEVEVDL